MPFFFVCIFIILVACLVLLCFRCHDLECAFSSCLLVPEIPVVLLHVCSWAFETYVRSTSFGCAFNAMLLFVLYYLLVDPTGSHTHIFALDQTIAIQERETPLEWIVCLWQTLIHSCIFLTSWPLTTSEKDKLYSCARAWERKRVIGRFRLHAHYVQEYISCELSARMHFVLPDLWVYFTGNSFWAACSKEHQWYAGHTLPRSWPLWLTSHCT